MLIHHSVSDQSCQDLKSALEETSVQEVDQMLLMVSDADQKMAVASGPARFQTLSLDDLVELAMEVSRSAMSNTAISDEAQSIVQEAPIRQAVFRNTGHISSGVSIA